MSAPQRLAVLGSGTGSNFVALQQAILAGKLNAEIVLVISDVPGAPILARALEFDLPAASLPPSPRPARLSPDAESVLLEMLESNGVGWVILAGYMRIVRSAMIQKFPQRIINIHPSLLPQFKGLRAWEQALAAGVKETGCTVHYINEKIDDGEIIAQQRVPVLPDDTPETLHARIQIAEHELYPRALSEVFAKAG